MQKNLEMFFYLSHSFSCYDLIFDVKTFYQCLYKEKSSLFAILPQSFTDNAFFNFSKFSDENSQRFKTFRVTGQ